MIPAGYMAKRVSLRPEWIKAERVADIYSVSGCVSKDFADYIKYWKHNGYWFFDSPEIILRLARQNSIDLTGVRLFFYEVHELEFADTEGRWTTFEPEPSFSTQVVVGCRGGNESALLAGFLRAGPATAGGGEIQEHGTWALSDICRVFHAVALRWGRRQARNSAVMLATSPPRFPEPQRQMSVRHPQLVSRRSSTRP
jgi:hypothetical protein